MIRTEDHNLQKMMDILSKLQLQAQDVDIIESYLRGESGDGALRQIGFYDLSAADRKLMSQSESLFQKWKERGYAEEIEKFFHVLFAVGKTTCYGFLPIYSWNYTLDKEDAGFEIDRGRLLAVEAAEIVSNHWHMNQTWLSNLWKNAKKDTAVIRAALDACGETDKKSWLLLCALYFLYAYPNETHPKGSGAYYLLESTTPPVAKGDEPLLAEYETLLLDSILQLTGGKISPLESKGIVKLLRQENMDLPQLKSAVKCASGLAVGPARLYCGCAFINYTLSGILKNYVTMCIAIDTGAALEAMVQNDCRNDLSVRGGNFDDIFGIDAKHLISWAAQKRHVNILRAQFVKNQEMFLSYYRGAEYETAAYLRGIIEEMDADLYVRMMKTDGGRQKEKTIDLLVPASTHSELAKDYLRGEQPLAALYGHNDLIVMDYSWNSGNIKRKAVEEYDRHYHDRAFYSRCVCMMLIQQTGSFFIWGNQRDIAREAIEKVYRCFEDEKMDLMHQIVAIRLMLDTTYNSKWQEQILQYTKDIFAGYLKNRREETLTAVREGGCVQARQMGLALMAQAGDDFKEEMLSYTADTSKAVRGTLLELLCEKKEWHDDLVSLLAGKKAAEREIAIRALDHWNQPQDKELLMAALEKEKNGKVRALLESVLNETSGGGKNQLSVQDIVKNYHSGGKKRTLAWAYEQPFSKVHKTDGAEAEEEYLQALLLCYASMGKGGVNPDAKTLAAELNEEELAFYVNELFDKWMDTGAPAKRSWVLYVASIHGGGDIVKKLHHQIQEWPANSRGAIASEAVKALALNPKPQALLIVDGIARKFKFKQVKAAAGDALDFAAEQLGITRDELEDRIVPDLGFNDKMERIFDYGARKFTVTITTALEIEVYDENGKKLKNIPAPGKRDDEELAKASYAEFKEMKKQMKTTVASHKMRLELALSSKRSWEKQQWSRLFVDNPIMHQFAIGLIWGIYANGELKQTFRYMEDGSFNTVEEEEYELPEHEKIGLVHPIELTEQELAAWKEQLEDYEITQPILQLERQIYYRTPEEEEAKRLERFGGKVLSDYALMGKLTALGWYRGSVQDAGGFDTFYREDASLGIGAELHFSGTYVGGMGEDVTVYDVRFYQAGTIARGSYMYDEAELSKAYFLKELPERYFSEIVLQLTQATASSEETDEGWKKSAGIDK